MVVAPSRCLPWRTLSLYGGLREPIVALDVVGKDGVRAKVGAMGAAAHPGAVAG